MTENNFLHRDDKNKHLYAKKCFWSIKTNSWINSMNKKLYDGQYSENGFY